MCRRQPNSMSHSTSSAVEEYLSPRVGVDVVFICGTLSSCHPHSSKALLVITSIPTISIPGYLCNILLLLVHLFSKCLLSPANEIAHSRPPVTWYNVGWFQPHAVRVTCMQYLGCKSNYLKTQDHSAARTIGRMGLILKFPELFNRFHIWGGYLRFSHGWSSHDWRGH